MGQIEVVKVLVDAGATIQATDEHEPAPIELARNSGHAKVVAYLRRKSMKHRPLAKRPPEQAKDAPEDEATKTMGAPRKIVAQRRTLVKKRRK